MVRVVRLQSLGDHGVPDPGSLLSGMLQSVPLVPCDHDEHKAMVDQGRAGHTAGPRNFAVARLGAFAMVVSTDVLNGRTSVIIEWLRLRV